jgi:hypothetical protein
VPQPMNGILVLVASPGDALEERAAVREALVDWNINRGRRDNIALLPWLFERHAVARVGQRPQAVINGQAVDQADVVVAFFDSRLGTATGVDVSGTAEEINRAADLGKPVHVYFSEEPLPRDVDGEQLEALRAFQADLEQRGLMGRFVDPADLVGQVVRAIESDIDEARWADPHPRRIAEQVGSDLVWRHAHAREPRGLDKRGKMQYRTTANDLVVTNDGSVPAEKLTFEVSAVGPTHFAFPEPPEEPVTVHPHSSLSWTFIPTPSWGAPGNTVEIKARWTEDGEQKEATRTITLESG